MSEITNGRSGTFFADHLSALRHGKCGIHAVGRVSLFLRLPGLRQAIEAQAG